MTVRRPLAALTLAATALAGLTACGRETPADPLNPAAKSGQTLMYWAYFAAPEDDIDTISVGVGQVEFTDVVIER